MENPLQQIMILAHNRNLLKYLHDAIQYRNIATVGYYVGGMKEQALKETESKKVVIATYNMAAEALDIKTLTTLIMATPKTDIQQSVGRILREKHSNPIVVDIIDAHDTFQNQWRKRKIFYKKENYKIIHTTNSHYDPDTSKWNVIYNPKTHTQDVKRCGNKKQVPKNTSMKSHHSTDSSIAQDSDDEDEDDPQELPKSKDKYLCGKCLLTFKK
jgi:superfamily II DNA or RNA helicase